MREFLLTYRYYATTTEVLELLFDRFRKNLTTSSPTVPAIIPLRFLASFLLLSFARKRSSGTIFLSFLNRVINFIRRWLKEFFYDLEDDEQSLSLIEQFLDVDVAKADAPLARWVDQIKKIIKEQVLILLPPLFRFLLMLTTVFLSFQTAAKAFPAPSGGLKRFASLPADAFPSTNNLVYDEEDHHDGYTKTDFTNINPVGEWSIFLIIHFLDGGLTPLFS